MSIYQARPDRFTPDELAQNGAPAIYAAVAVLIPIATAGVILRLVSRLYSKAKMGYDDLTIILALMFFYALSIVVILDATFWGLGRHMPAVDPSKLPPFQKDGLANLVLYLTTTFTVKVSLLLLYNRYFGISSAFCIALRICAVIIVSWYLALVSATIFQCTPVAAFWDRTILLSGHGKCLQLSKLGVASGITNLLTDVMILVIPIPMVWGLNTSKAQKWTLTGIFTLGFFVCAISIVRITHVAHINPQDVTWSLKDTNLWTIAEPSIGILSACLPTLRPLFGRFFHFSSSFPARSASVNVDDHSGSGSGSSGVKRSAAMQSTSVGSPGRGCGFRRLDEEAGGFPASPPMLPRKAGVGTTEVWDHADSELPASLTREEKKRERDRWEKGGGGRTAMHEMEMNDYEKGFERLPRRERSPRPKQQHDRYGDF